MAWGRGREQVPDYDDTHTVYVRCAWCHISIYDKSAKVKEQYCSTVSDEHAGERVACGRGVVACV